MTKKYHFNLLMIGCVATFLIFIGYNGLRAMQATVGFHFMAAIICFAPLLFVTCIISGIVTLLTKLWIHTFYGIWWVMIIPSCVVGCVIGESWILWDEIRFQKEAIVFLNTHDTENGYSRDRIWPNAGTSLVFIRGKGYHATD